MKKVLSSLLAVTLLFAGISAHAQTTDSAKAAKKAARAEKKAEKAKEKAAAAATTTTTPAVKPAPAPTPAAPAVKPATPKTVTQGTNKTADKAVGTDAKGRTIYEGPKGGRYTLTAAGNKEYIKKTN